jgi:hypothetical protein
MQLKQLCDIFVTSVPCYEANLIHGNGNDNEMVLHLGAKFYESFYPLKMMKFGTQHVQQMTEMA